MRNRTMSLVLFNSWHCFFYVSAWGVGQRDNPPNYQNRRLMWADVAPHWL